MITIYKVDNVYKKPSEDEIFVELRGVSTDEKPTEVANKKVGNGSAFIEIDTQKIYFYDGESEEWIGA